MTTEETINRHLALVDKIEALQAELEEERKPKFPKVEQFHWQGRDHEIRIVGEIFDDSRDGAAWKTIIFDTEALTRGAALIAWLDEEYPSEHCHHAYDCCAQFYCNGWNFTGSEELGEIYTTVEVSWSQNV